MKTLEDFVPIADGMRLHYRVIGTGSEIVLVPGKAWISRQLDGAWKIVRGIGTDWQEGKVVRSP